MSKIISKIREYIVEPFLNSLFPMECASCGSYKIEENGFCKICNGTILRISSPLCKVCGTPFQNPKLKDGICGRCLKCPPPYNKVISLYEYGGGIQEAIIRLKYHGRVDLSHNFYKLLKNTEIELPKDINKAIFIPMSTMELKQRGYNHLELIFGRYLKEKGIMVIKGLQKVKETLPQASLELKKRKENIKDGFKLNPTFYNIIKGEKVLVIDDVITSGYTVLEAAKVLKKEGKAKEIYVLSLAKKSFG